MHAALLALSLTHGATPQLDTTACPEFDTTALASALELELAAEPEAAAGEGTVVVECTPERVRVRVQSSDGTRERTIAGADRLALSERSLALAIAPLFVASTEPAAEPQDVPEAPTVAEPPSTEAEPAPMHPGPPTPPPPTPRAPAVRAAPPSTPTDDGRSALVLRPLAFVHDAPGVGGSIGWLRWAGRHVGIGVLGTARWGRATRDRGHVDALVAGGGPVLAVRQRSDRLGFRADLLTAIAYASLQGTRPRGSTRALRAERPALDIALALGIALPVRHAVLVPQIVGGTTPGAPLGVVSGERSVSLAMPYAGLALSIEPWVSARHRGPTK